MSGLYECLLTHWVRLTSAVTFISAPLVPLTSPFLAHLPRQFILQPSVRCFLYIFFFWEEVISGSGALRPEPFEGVRGGAVKQQVMLMAVRHLAHHRERERESGVAHARARTLLVLEKKHFLFEVVLNPDTPILRRQLSLSWSPPPPDPAPPPSLLLWLIGLAINQDLVYLAVCLWLFGRALIGACGKVNRKQRAPTLENRCKFSSSSGEGKNSKCHRLETLCRTGNSWAEASQDRSLAQECTKGNKKKKSQNRIFK